MATSITAPVPQTTITVAYHSLIDISSTLSAVASSRNATSTTPKSTEDGPEYLFKLVATAAAVSGAVFVMSVIALVVCCHKRRRRRTVNVDSREGKTYGKHGLTYSLKRTFSDGPLYAVTNLHLSRSFPEGHGHENKSSANDDKPVYEQYLTPAEGIPVLSSNDSEYLQPMDGGQQPPDAETARSALKRKLKQQEQQQTIREARNVDQALYEEVTRPESKITTN